MASLDELLDEANALFGDKPESACYRFTLGRIAGEWMFTVVDSWSLWMRARLDHEFRGRTPAEAVQRFLAYVRTNKIDVKALTEEASR